MNSITLSLLHISHSSLNPDETVPPYIANDISFLLEMGLVAQGYGITCVTPAGEALIRANTLQ